MYNIYIPGTCRGHRASEPQTLIPDSYEQPGNHTCSSVALLTLSRLPNPDSHSLAARLGFDGILHFPIHSVTCCFQWSPATFLKEQGPPLLGISKKKIYHLNIKKKKDSHYFQTLGL